MKMQKTAMAVLMLAAGLTSGAALAGQTVTWGPSDSGTAKDVIWEVLRPSKLSFTMTPVDITAMDAQGKINTNGDAGTWANSGPTPAWMTLKAADKFTASATSQKVIQAKGTDAGNNEFLLVTLNDGTKDLDLTDAYDVKKGHHFDASTSGKMTGKLVDAKGAALTDWNKVSSSKFVASITVSSTQP